MAERFRVAPDSAVAFQEAVGKINRRGLDRNPRKFTGRGYSIKTPKNIIDFPHAYQVEKQGEYKFFYITYEKLEQASLQALVYHCEESILQVLKDEIKRLKTDERPDEEIREILIQLITFLDLKENKTPQLKTFTMELQALLESLTATQSRTSSPESPD